MNFMEKKGEPIIEIDKVTLPLNIPRGKIRISDKDGNHISKIIDCIYSIDLNIEWMITNYEIEQLIDVFLNNNEKSDLKNQLVNINNFVKTSNYSKRIALKGNRLEDFEDFKVFENSETFYSFERTNLNGIGNKVVFKMGDFILAPHYFLLIPFGNNKLELKNNNIQRLEIGSNLGNGAQGLWQIEISDIKYLVSTIATISVDHKNDMINLLS